MAKCKFEVGQRVKVKSGGEKGRVGWVTDRDYLIRAGRILYCIYEDADLDGYQSFIGWLYSYELDPYPLEMVELEDML